MYYNGWEGPDRGHGHAIYAQNETGTKRIRDNIQFNGYGMGLRAYGTENAFARNIDFIRNVSFNSGTLFRDPPYHWDNFMVTVGSGADKIRFEENHSYHPPASEEGSTKLGWMFSGVEKELTARGNYFIGGVAAVEVWNWNQVTFEKNTMYSDGNMMALLNHLDTQDRSGYHWRDNTYYGSGVVRLNGKNMPWQPWLEASSLDSGSKHIPGRPKGTWSFLYPNEYEPARANLIVYNWERSPAVQIDLSKVVPQGSRFEVRDAQNFFAKPVTEGVFEGGLVSIPMTGLTMARPEGRSALPHTAPEFGVFVVLPAQPSPKQ